MSGPWSFVPGSWSVPGPWALVLVIVGLSIGASAQEPRSTVRDVAVVSGRVERIDNVLDWAYPLSYAALIGVVVLLFF